MAGSGFTTKTQPNVCPYLGRSGGVDTNLRSSC
jgi:hypothetical protein